MNNRNWWLKNVEKRNDHHYLVHVTYKYKKDEQARREDRQERKRKKKELLEICGKF